MTLEAEWDDLLRRNPSQSESMMAALREAGLMLGGRPLCSLMRPCLLTARQYDEDAHVSATVLSALDKAGQRLREDADLARFYLGHWFEDRADLLSLDHGFRHDTVCGRLDAYRTAEGLQFLEYNAGLPGGFSQQDDLASCFRHLETFARFTERHPLNREGMLEGLRRGLVQAWQEWGGQGDPALTLVATPEMLANPVIERGIGGVLRSLQAMGLECHQADLAQLEWQGGRLRHEGRPVEMLLRAFLTDQVADRALLRPALEALRARAACMVNPFTFHGHKALFDLVTDPSLDLGFTEEERRVVDRHVPWSRLVRSGPTVGPDGETAEVVDLALRHRESLVLKSVDGMGGKEVVLGWTVAEDEWRSAVTAAAASRRWIVQRKVDSPPRTFPLLEGLQDVQVHLDCCPLMINGRMAGYMVRASTTEMTNLSLGGSVIPTFVLER